MGVTQSNFSETLQFVQILNDIHFGQVEILKNQENKFIMKNNKSYITGDKRYNEFKKIIDFVQTKTNPNLIPILYIEQQHQSNVCIQYEKVSIYTQYFNFTLDGLILHKKQIQIPQLWYCTRSLLDLVTLFIQNNLKIQMFLDNIFLTLKGVPSVYLYHLMEEDFIKNGENVIRQSDIVESRTMFYQLGKIILQLLCMQKIPQGQQEMETFFIQQLICKAEEKNILLTNFIKELLTAKYSDILNQKLQSLIKQKKIKISNQIRFNKFKYVIPDEKNQKKNLQIKIDSQASSIKPTQLHSIISNSYKTPLYKLQSNRTFSTQNIKQKAKTQYQQKNLMEKRLDQFELNKKSKQFFANPKIDVFDQTISEKCKNQNQNQKISEPISIKPRKKSQSISNKSRQLKRTQSEKQENQMSSFKSKTQKSQVKQNIQTSQPIMNSNNNSKLLDRMKILTILKEKQETFNINSSRNSNSNLDSNDFLSEIEKKKIQNQKKMMELNMRKQMMEKGFKKSKREGFQSQDKQNKTTHNTNESQQLLVRHSSSSLRQNQKVNPKSISYLSSLKCSDKRIPSNLNTRIIPKLKQI